MPYCDVPRYTADCQRLGITLTDEQRRAFWFLEKNGQRFCVDFGTDNAVAKAERLRVELFARRLRPVR